MLHNVRRALASVLLAAFLLATASGCAYMRDRGNDFLDAVDLGLTFSKKPYFAAYYRLPVPIGALGYGHVEGHFLGLAGGRLGWMPHYEESYGLILWGSERVAFGVYDRENEESLNYARVGIIGLVQGPLPPPGYMLGCPHYLHLGWIGAVGHPRVLDWLDFLLGWTTLDISGDDGDRPRTYWPWQEPALPPELWTAPEHRGYIGRP